MLFRSLKSLGRKKEPRHRVDGAIRRKGQMGIQCGPVRLGLSPYASVWHFFMKLFFAAPVSGLPSLLTAFGSRESFLHFLTNAAFAAPDSGFPSLPTASASHALCANVGVTKNSEIRTAKAVRIGFLLRDKSPDLGRTASPGRESRAALPLNVRQPKALPMRGVNSSD